MAVSKRLRFEILRRDNHACKYCGATSPDAVLTVDHVVPTALGGCDDPTNLVAACRDCNAGKSSVSTDAALVADVAADAMRWACAMEKAAEIDRQKRSSDRLFLAAFADQMVSIYESDTYRYELPSMDVFNDREGAIRTLARFRDAGLDLDDMTAAIRKAMGNRKLHERDVWRYFCGICWRVVEERQSTARALIEAEEADGRG